MKSWYTFSAKANSTDVADLSIFDYIGYYGVEASHFIADLKKIEAKTINVSINSPGGDVFQAIAMMAALRASGKTINMNVLGIAASAAAYMVLAGDKRTMTENAMQMVHNASWSAYGNADALQAATDVLRKVDANLQATFVTRTGLSAEKVAELLSTDTYLTAAECLELGLIDEVTPTMKITAAFDIDRLPENVQALFKAALETDPEAEAALAAATLAEEVAAAAAAAAAAALVEATAQPGFAEQVQAKLVAADLGDFISAFVLDASIGTIEALDTAIAAAREVRSLCALVKKPESASDFISQRLSLTDVRAKLSALLADADEATHIDTAPKSAQTPVTQKPEAFSASSYWNRK